MIHQFVHLPIAFRLWAVEFQCQIADDFLAPYRQPLIQPQQPTRATGGSGGMSGTDRKHDPQLSPHLIQPLIIPLPIRDVGIMLPSPLPHLFGRPPAQDAAIDASKVWDMAASAQFAASGRI